MDQEGNWLGLSSRVCVVTGAGSGIGAETARHLAAQGAVVALIDRHAEAAEAVVAQITRSGGRALAIAADVSDSQAVARAADTVLRALGPCQVLVNNAGVLRGEALMGLSLDAWNQVLSVNLTGALLCSQAFAAQMIQAAHGGSIVHVGSITGHQPLPGSGAYGVSKAGLGMLSRLLSLELAAHGIRSNLVSPGLVRTPLTEHSYQDPAVALARQSMVPAGRIGLPADLASAIAFLASERASYITGQDILVDGGLGQGVLRSIPSAAAPDDARAAAHSQNTHAGS